MDRIAHLATWAAALLPGAALSAVGLWRQRSELGAAGMTGIRPYAAAAAATLAAYAVVGGMIVADGPVSPGGVGDAGGWFDATSLPLEVVRGILGLVLCVLAVKLLEYVDKIGRGLTLTTNHFFELYYLMTGFHALHVVMGIVLLAIVAWRASQENVETGAAFWHMVDLIWVMLFPVVYLIR